MFPTDSRRLFDQAFDTFKAFDDLTVENSSVEQVAFPTSIWQILHHLLEWQTHQLGQLQGTASADAFDETQSWTVARAPISEAALQAAVKQFKQQLVELRTWASEAQGDASQILTQGLVLQSVALHLSFHLGEVVLMRRLQGSYPLPAHMAAFLQA